MDRPIERDRATNPAGDRAQRILDILDDTQYARVHRETRSTRDLLEAEGFAVEALLFVTLVNGEDGIRYAMFVAPNGQVYELEHLEHDVDGDSLHLWPTDDVHAAAQRVPQLPTALGMVRTAETAW